jgi:hypothetical protein
MFNKMFWKFISKNFEQKGKKKDFLNSLKKLTRTVKNGFEQKLIAFFESGYELCF